MLVVIMIILLSAVRAFYVATAECFIFWCATKLLWNIFSTREYGIILTVLWIVNFIISCIKVLRLYKD